MGEKALVANITALALLIFLLTMLIGAPDPSWDWNQYQSQQSLSKTSEE